MTDLVASERAISFGPFRLVQTQQLLLENDNPVRVGGRALDMLTALVQRPGAGRQRGADGPRVARHLCRGGKSQISSRRLAAGAGRWPRQNIVEPVNA